MPKAREAARRALELDESLAEAHTSLGLVKFFFDWDWPGAEAEFARAIELNPGYVTAHHGYAAYLAIMHRPDEALVEARRALDADPLSLPVNSILGEMLVGVGRYDEAVEQYRRALQLEPNFALAMTNLGHALRRQGKEKEAVEQYLKAEALSGTPAARVEELRRSYEHGGLQAFRRRQLERAIAEWNGWHSAAATIGFLHLSLGEVKQALPWLEKAYAMPSGALLWLNTRDGVKTFRSDPAFDALCRRIGLPG